VTDLDPRALEAAARSVYNADGPHVHHWDVQHPSRADEFRYLARAAVTAYLEASASGASLPTNDACALPGGVEESRDQYPAPPAAQDHRPPEICIGQFVIRHAPNGIWIGRTDGEGGEFGTEQVEHAIAQFYRANF
jgi:hypothetical protein